MDREPISTSDFKTLHIEEDGAVLTLRLDTPEAGNAVDEPMLDELLAVLSAVHDRPDLRVLVLSGAGQDFCLGGAREEFGTLLAEDATGAGLHAVANKARRVCDALASLPAATIARVHGKAVGAGLGLALHCDLRAAADTATFRLPELGLGLPTTWGGALQRLLHEVGAARMRELILTARVFDAAEAERIGVAHRVVPEAELDKAVAQWTKPLLRRSPTALRTTKALLNAYAAAGRQGDLTLLDAQLLTFSAAARR
ncbi:enoyl-CoA hydratase/isomerase family protein [Streptomyces sp. JJ38]|uniref:enoyl-CoA hydratase/isomerase family protein n=1 Tax=Streptomyces sp. JJ38 TaxID=2738128 RepID=UPI0027E0E1CB|nr:enoyl-CoA hydratase/isomerase family protein [Streptomyces sp. JJ38]